MALAKHCEEIRIKVEESFETRTGIGSGLKTKSWKNTPEMQETESLPGIYHPSCKSRLFERVQPYPGIQPIGAATDSGKKKRGRKVKATKSV